MRHRATPVKKSRKTTAKGEGEYLIVWVVFAIMFIAACCFGYLIAHDRLVKVPVAAPQKVAVAVVVSTPKPTPTKSWSCETVDRAFGEAIVKKTRTNTGIKYVRGEAFKSLDFKMYFIAVEFAASGIGNETMMLVSPTMTTTGMMAADEMAKAFTLWPDVAVTNPEIVNAAAQMDRAISCLR